METEEKKPHWTQLKKMQEAKAAEEQPKKFVVPQPKKKEKWDIAKRYQFKLSQVYDAAKPRDADTNEILDNPYPPTYLWVNSGVAINPETNEVENWRYVYGYSSIWVKDQQKPEPSKQQLENPKNDIVFKNGSLFVNGNNKALLEALTVQDAFEGVENPINNMPFIYGLVDENKNRERVRSEADMAYLAEKSAREATLEQMVPVAMHFGIDVTDPDENEDRIRTEFILKAKAMPREFSNQFTNPKNEYKYNIVQALQLGIISADKIPGKMVLNDTGAVYFDVKIGDDVADQFASLMMIRNDKAIKLYSQIENILAGSNFEVTQ